MFDTAAQESDEKAIEIIQATSNVSKIERIKAFDNLESMILQYEQAVVPVVHRFCGDMYMREITLEKDSLLTGRIHKFDHFDIMLSGDISVSSDDGKVRRMTGLNIMEGKAGKKRAGWVHEETHWITIHSAQEQDPEGMVEFLTVETFEQLEEFQDHFALAMKQLNDDEQIILDHIRENCSEEI